MVLKSTLDFLRKFRIGDTMNLFTFWYEKLCPMFRNIAGSNNYCFLAMNDGNCPFHGRDDNEPRIVIAEVVSQPLYTQDPIQGPYTGERKPQDR